LNHHLPFLQALRQLLEFEQNLRVALPEVIEASIVLVGALADLVKPAMLNPRGNENGKHNWQRRRGEQPPPCRQLFGGSNARFELLLRFFEPADFLS